MEALGSLYKRFVISLGAYFSTDNSANGRTMSIDYAKKLLCIRKAENLTQQRFSDLTQIPLNTIKKYETGQQPAGASTMESVIQTDEFKKYAMWLTINETFEAAGQISPPLSPYGQEKETSPRSERKTG